MATNTSLKNLLKARRAEMPKAKEVVQTTINSEKEPNPQPVIKTSIQKVKKGYTITLDITINLEV